MVCPRGGGGGLRSPVSFPLFCVTTGVFQSLTSLTGRGLDGTHTRRLRLPLVTIPSASVY